MFNYLAQLPESLAMPLFERLWTQAGRLSSDARAPVLEDALRVAGHFGRIDVVKSLVSALSSLMMELARSLSGDENREGDGVAAAAQVLTAAVYTLRRLGLREEAQDMLLRVRASFKKEDRRQHLMARVAIAGGFAYLGETSEAAPAIDDALTHLANEKSPMFGHLTHTAVASDVNRLARVTARALSIAPADFALPRLLRLSAPLPWLTDLSPMNEYLCLSVVELADIIAVGHVSDDLTWSEVARTFLEEDEGRVRLRIHRDANVKHPHHKLRAQ
jgi:hypothetical protein